MDRPIPAPSETTAFSSSVSAAVCSSNSPPTERPRPDPAVVDVRPCLEEGDRRSRSRVLAQPRAPGRLRSHPRRAGRRAARRSRAGQAASRCLRSLSSREHDHGRTVRRGHVPAFQPESIARREGNARHAAVSCGVGTYARAAWVTTWPPRPGRRRGRRRGRSRPPGEVAEKVAGQPPPRLGISRASRPDADIKEAGRDGQEPGGVISGKGSVLAVVPAFSPRPPQPRKSPTKIAERPAEARQGAGKPKGRGARRPGSDRGRPPG